MDPNLVALELMGTSLGQASAEISAAPDKPWWEGAQRVLSNSAEEASAALPQPDEGGKLVNLILRCGPHGYGITLDSNSEERAVLVSAVATGSPNFRCVYAGDEVVSIAGHAVRYNHDAVIAHLSHHEAEAEGQPEKVHLPCTVLRGAITSAAARLRDKLKKDRAAERASTPWDGLLTQLDALDEIVMRVVDPELAQRVEEEKHAAAAELPLEREELTLARAERLKREQEEQAAREAEGPSERARAREERRAARAERRRLRFENDETTDEDDVTTAESDNEYGTPPLTADLAAKLESQKRRPHPAARPKLDVHSIASVVAAKRAGKAVASASLSHGTSLSAQAVAAEVDRKWERVLATRVLLVRGGTTIELTGRQIVGLQNAAAVAPGQQVAFMHGGTKVVLSLQAATALRGRLEEKLHAEMEADALVRAPLSYSEYNSPTTT